MTTANSAQATAPDTRQPGFFQGIPATPAAATSPTAATRARRPAAPPPTPARVALAAPWADPTKWDSITIAGITFTGKVTVTGDALKKKNDHRSGRGRNGGRTVASGHDLVDFTVTLACFPEDDDATEDLHIQQLDAIFARLSDEAPTRQDTSAIPVAYPSLAAARISMATLDSVGLVEYEAGGLAMQTYKFKSFRDPVPRAVRAAATPAETAAAAAVLSNGARGEYAAGRADGTLSIAPIDRGPRIERPSTSGAAAPR